MLKSLHCVGLLSLAMLCLVEPAAAEAPPADGPGLGTKPAESAAHPNVHSRPHQLPRVMDLVLSSDGRHLAAAYHVAPLNRPGTDWGAWVAVWDLTTGRRTIIANATEPLAISPDGQWLAMGSYARSKERRSIRTPRGEPALWKPGVVEPARKLASDVEPGTWLAWTFSADGKSLFAINNDGALVGWDLDGETPGEKIATLVVPEAGTPAVQDNRPPKLGRPAELFALDGGLGMIGVLENRLPGAVEVVWRRGKSGWSQDGARIVARQSRADTALERALSRLRYPHALSLPADLAISYVQAGPRPPSLGSLPMSSWLIRLAFAPNERLVAFSEPGAALATVREIDGQRRAQFSAAAVHAFTPDGSQLIVSDRRGILRFWDVAAGRIVRTLRLDDEPADTFLAAAIQAASEFGQPTENRKRLASLIADAAQRGADVVVLPETTVTGYMSDDLEQTWQVDSRPVTSGLTGVDPAEAAETVPGPSTQFFGDVARQWGIYLTVPLLEVDRKTDRYYNTVVLLGPDGGILIHYRKVNPWPWAERGWASPGNLGHAVADTPFGRLGVLICYDVHEQAKWLAELKIDTLLYSIAWVDEKDSDWFPRYLPKIAAAHQYNIVAANWTVARGRPEPAWHGYGQSAVVDATGRVLASAETAFCHAGGTPRDEGVILAELPLPADDRLP